ncbi:DUF2235 domain-containing protein [Variovorax humicola]|uniref:DUF2235 domain-containing protein n=1 Tax=Variovorax humicola TaxID=1769758 RepID=A0ABU8VY90_9BURK
MPVEPMPSAVSGQRPLTLQEEMRRGAAMTCIDYKQRENLCASMIYVGIFFDGTNNNRDRDKVEVMKKTNDPNQCYHSNIAVLFETHKDHPKNGYHRYYVPGVGTPFKDIGELKESQDGKAKASGGDARINWALIQLINSMHREIHGKRLIEEDEVGRLATSAPLHVMGPGANVEGKREFFRGEDGNGGKLAELERALKARPPKKLLQVNLSVFGFSRGAAQARAFCHFLHEALLKVENVGGKKDYTLAGVALRVQFLGLFDTVASVGLADSSPFWHGLGGWANGTMDIAPNVERTLHLVAGHEIRQNFPLSCGRTGSRYPSNIAERVYPGAHSNVGGGYAPGDQGKSMGQRSRLLSQIPLNDMYREAFIAGVPLLSEVELRANDEGSAIANDLKVDPETAELFDIYRRWKPVEAGLGIEETLNGHMRNYWFWRLRYQDKLDLESAKRSSDQDRIDLDESNVDFRSDAMQAHALDESHRRFTREGGGQNQRPQPLSEAQREFLKLEQEFKLARGEVHPKVHRFFDELVHDSHASFYMIGPITQADRDEKIAQIQRKDEQIKAAREARATAMHRGNTPPPWPPREETLSDLEQRILAYQKTHPGEFPLLTDEDRDALLALEDFTTRGAVRLVTRGTRRELGGHVRFRRVFDKS